jgi:hypothetical protein
VSLTSPANIGYSCQVIDPNTGVNILGPGYIIQPASSGQTSWCTTASGSTTCNFDNFNPNLGTQATIQTGPAGPAGAPGVTPNYRGTWSSSTTYAANDAVLYSGAEYISLLGANLNQNPASATTYWSVFVPSGTPPTAANMQSAVSGLTGCTTAGNPWNPATNTCAAAGGSSSTDCPSVGANDICLTRAPYYASTSGNVTTSTSGTSAPGTTVNVASTSTFVAGNGIDIAGAGSGASLYIGNVASIVSSTQMTVTPATSTSVSGGTLVRHNDYTAFNAAVSAIAAFSVPSGRILLPGPGAVYRFNGSLQQTSGANAMLPMPQIPSQNSPYADITIEGVSDVPEQLTTGAQIFSDYTGAGNLIGCQNSTSTPYGPFCGATLHLKNLQIVGPNNPCMVLVNATWMELLQVENVNVGAGGGTPSCTTGGGIYFPTMTDLPYNEARQSGCYGLYTCAIFTEHTHIYEWTAGNSVFPASFDNGAGVGLPAGYVGNSIQADHIWLQATTHGLSGGAHGATINVSDYSAELLTTDEFYDPSNLLHGYVKFHNPYLSGYSGSSGPCSPRINGGANLIVDLEYCPVARGGGGGGSAPVPVEFWKSQDGSGSTLANSGTDVSNTATATSVTWTAPSGWSHAVATYNGTNSVSLASSAAGTGFTGTTPFSICAWIRPSTLTGFTSATFVGNNTGTTGMNFNLLGSGTGGAAGALNVGLNGSGPNYIVVVTPPGSVSAAVTSNVCMTYSGSTHASSIAVYVNGVAQTLTTQYDAITTMAAATQPFMIGNQPGTSEYFNGAIGDVEYFSSQLTGSQIAAIYAAGP